MYSCKNFFCAVNKKNCVNQKLPVHFGEQADPKEGILQNTDPDGCPKIGISLSCTINIPSES